MTTLFKLTSYSVEALISGIERRKIGLPDIQRPFIWTNNQVRELFDSLYKGYPAGALLLWETGSDGDLTEIGTSPPSGIPDIAVLDGQQRLTSLYAVIKGQEVIRRDNKKEFIKVSFNAFTEKFLVDKNVSKNDKFTIPNISDLWKSELNAISAANSIIDKLPPSEGVSDQIKEKIQTSIVKIHNMPGRYYFNTVEISNDIDTNTAAEIFVRINGTGTQLKQADFVMTLMSVIWDEGRTKIEKFAISIMNNSGEKNSPNNRILKLTSDQLLRAVVGFSFRKARLDEVYSTLYEKRSKSDEESNLLEDLRRKQAAVLDIRNWNNFIDALSLSGYCSEYMTKSKTVAIYSYVLYLIGVEDYQLDCRVMQKAISEFFFMATLRTRYSGSFETQFEKDLMEIKRTSGGDEYLEKLREMCNLELTDEFWNNVLPSQLETSGTKSPFLIAYYASLVIHDADVMNGDEKVRDILNGALKLKRHRLFSRELLKKRGIDDTRMINQVANYTIGKWFGKMPPDDEGDEDLFSLLIPADSSNEMYTNHALPQSWWDIPYDEFLMERRKLMAGVIENAWRKLTGDQVRPRKIERDLEEIINSGESSTVEFKSTLRTNLSTGRSEKGVHMNVLKSIASFLNTEGGMLLIGVNDEGQVLGIEKDGFSSHDEMVTHLGNTIQDCIGGYFRTYVRSEFVEVQNRIVMVTRCKFCNRAAYVSERGRKKFYVRGDGGDSELQGDELQSYLNFKFPKL